MLEMSVDLEYARIGLIDPPLYLDVGVVAESPLDRPNSRSVVGRRLDHPNLPLLPIRPDKLTKRHPLPDSLEVVLHQFDAPALLASTRPICS